MRALLLLATLLCSPAAQASEWQAAANTLMLLDWAQTRNIARNPERWYETNPLLGNHPSAAEVDVYFLASLITINGVGTALPKRWSRHWFQAFAFHQALHVLSNQQLGISVRF